MAGLFQKVRAALLGLYLERILRIASALVSTALIARYLGPEQFGELSFLLSIVAILGAVAGLGLSDILIKRLAVADGDNNALLIALTVRTVAGLVLCIAGLVLVSGILDRAFPGQIFCLLIVALAPLYSFEQLLLARSAAIGIARAGTLELVLTLVLRLAVIALDLGVAWIAFTFLFEAAVRLVLIVLYALRAGLLPPAIARVGGDDVGTMLADGLPLLFSAIAIILYMRMDIVMLRHFVGASEAGIYAAATRITESFYFVPVVLAAVLLGELSRIKDRDTLQANFIGLYRALFFLAVAISIAVLLSAELMIQWIFGPGYQLATDVTRIHVLSLPFVYLGVASGNWLVVNGLQRHSLYRTSFGLVINLIGNMLLIPAYGANGAALATVLSQFAASLLYDFIRADTRVMFSQKIRAISPFGRP